MRLVKSPAQMQALALDLRRKNTQIGFVPTMGFLHKGHLRLMARARQLVGNNGVVVASVFVNPTQFGPAEDYSTYPRDLARDARLCREAGVDIMFVPTAAQMYPKQGRKEFSTFVVEEKLSRSMEGLSRPTHFRGVTTVVAKLFNLVLPTVAVFGAKDWQQAMIVRRMVADLNFPVRIVVAPTVREPDGLAMSSRNQYLSQDERRQATILWRAICRAKEIVRSASKPVSAHLLKQELAMLISTQPAAQVDYIEFFQSDTLDPLEEVEPGAHIAMAVRIGRTRLIDNAKL
ncbi:MAG: pantoate--beta-alanine ligase [Verrucomicrobiota bacterium]|nr:pantoate--beta-alanine ligase [Verrucomicrobiota bacterium]